MDKIDCMDMMENLGYIDLIDHSNNICDLENLSDFQQFYANNSTRISNVDLVREELRPLDELGFMFLEWLKSNQPKISNVGSDFNLLGSTTEGKKCLLKLILEWASCEFPFRHEETSQNTSPNHVVNIAGAMAEYHTTMLDTAQTWPESGRFPTNNSNNYSSSSIFPGGQGCVEYGHQVPNQYYNGSGADNLVNLGLWGTKVARKKRMARRNRFLSHHRHQHSNSQNQSVDKQGRCGNENGVAVGKGTPALADGRQGWKSEKKLRFLLQKVLTRSDVGDLGRIVLPKKEAETHFPTLGSRSGIPIEMKDIGRSRVWNMRYRFWPNNNSRMYILENTGNFVRANGLREGDTILIYTHIKSNKYFIRGVKVQHPKKGSKSQKLHQEACIEP